MAEAKGIRAGKAFVEVFADDSKLAAGLTRAGNRLKAFGASVSAVGSRLMALGAAALAPLGAAAKLYGNMGDDLAKMSQRTGASVEALSELAYAANQADVDLEGLDKGLRKMQKFLDSAAQGSAGATDTLARLGLTISRLQGLSPDKQFELLADRLDRVKDPAAKAALAMKVFGREGTSLIPLMAGGATGIQELRKEAASLGVTISTQAATGAMKFHDTLKTLWAVVRRAGFAIGEALMPTLKKLAEQVMATIVNVTRWINNNKQVVTTVLMIASAAVAAGAAIWSLGKIISIAGISLRVLAVAFGFLSTPVGMVIGILAAVAAAIYWVVSSSKVLTNIFSQAMGGLWSMAKRAAEAVWSAMKSIGSAMQTVWQAVYNTVMPLIETFASSVATAFGVMSDFIGAELNRVYGLIIGVWDAVGGYISPLMEWLKGCITGAWNTIGSYIGPVLAWLQDAIIGAFSAITFAIKNWRAICEYVFLSAAYNIVKFANQVVYFFTEVIPATLRWFADNWRDIFQTIWNGVKTFCVNVWKNLANLWDAIVGLFKGEGWNFQWTGLMEGFESTIKELPQIAERQIGPMEAELAARVNELGSQLSEEWKKHDTEFRAKVDSYMNPAPEAPKAPAADAINRAARNLSNAGDDVEQAVGKVNISVVGSFNAAAAWGMGGNVDERTARASEETAKNTKKIAKNLEGGVLRFA